VVEVSGSLRLDLGGGEIWISVAVGRGEGDRGEEGGGG
jgi:hypothetical protein